MDFPNDPDGDALRKVAERSDMHKPMAIDFFVDVPNAASGASIARLASDRGYRAVVEFDEISCRWTCYCTKHMMATYDGVVSAQSELDALSKAFGGRCDGWEASGS